MTRNGPVSNRVTDETLGVWLAECNVRMGVNVVLSECAFAQRFTVQIDHNVQIVLVLTECSET